MRKLLVERRFLKVQIYISLGKGYMSKENIIALPNCCNQHKTLIFASGKIVFEQIEIGSKSRSINSVLLSKKFHH